MPEAPLVNDVHSRLNPTRVRAILAPASTQAVRVALAAAARQRIPVAVSGARHAMGGQPFATDALLLDLRTIQHVGPLDPERGLVEAGAGIAWPALIAALHTRQRGVRACWTIRQKQTGADDLTLGGALAANVHGRGLSLRPIIDDVEAFTLVDPQGEVRRCSRAENAEWFARAIGGYGLFGIITSVCLRLTRRCVLRRRVDVITRDELMPAFAAAIAAGAKYGDFQFAIDAASPDFLYLGVFACYEPLLDSAPAPHAPWQLRDDDWMRLVHLAHTEPTRAFASYMQHYRATHGQTYWSDTMQLSPYLPDYHDAIDARGGPPARASEMITELFVPRAALTQFLARAAELLRRARTPVIYGTVRLIERDTESFLPWAQQDFACVIFNLHTEHTTAGIAAASDAFRALIDAALDLHGTYYLTYHRWARRDQIERAHPRFAEFLAEKSRLDPEHRLQSDWWRHYAHLFGRGPTPAVATSAHATVSDRSTRSRKNARDRSVPARESAPHRPVPARQTATDGSIPPAFLPLPTCTSLPTRPPLATLSAPVLGRQTLPRSASH